jgi:hypothetical protein
MTETKVEVLRPHPKQWEFLQCPCNEILYGGAAGGGKSKGLVFDWVAHHAKYGKNAKGLMLRRTNSELEDMIRDMQVMFMSLPNPPQWKEQKKIFLYPDGAVLEMGYLSTFDDVGRYVGREFNWCGWDELTLWPDEESYVFLMSRMRSSAGVPVRVVSTTNPGGPGHSWVMKRWRIDEYPRGNKVEKIVQKMKDKTERVWTRVFIPALLSDNPSLDNDGLYRANLMGMNDTTRKKLLEGRWDVVEGAFFPEWNSDVHVVQSYAVPKTAKKWMAGDWGTSKPYAFLWAFESMNGDIVIYDEMYGCVDDKVNTGTREPASLVAQKIRQREREREFIITERYLDGSCWDPDGHEITVADLFRMEGVVFQKAVKKKKAGGINQLREKLKVVNGSSQLRVMSHCRNLIRTLPRLQTDTKNPDQYDTDGEDHLVDCLLYLVRRHILTEDEFKSKNRSGMQEMRLKQQIGPYGIY